MKLKELYQKITETLYVHLLWLLVSFLGLFITFGAATTALSRVMFQIYKKDEPTSVFKLFFKSFKENFKVATGVWFIILLAGVPLYFMLYDALARDDFILIVIALVAAYQIVMFTIYSFPIIALFETKSFAALIKNIFLIQTRFLWTNIKILGGFGAIILMMLFFHESLLLTVCLSYGFITTFHMIPIFEPFIERLKPRYEGDIEDGLLKL